MRVGQHGMAGPAVDQLSACLRTLRSVREFLPDDVSPQAIEFVIDHARRAGSGSNRQPWRFIVVRDAELRTQLGCWYRAGWDLLVTNGYTASASAGPAQQRITADAHKLAESFETAPVVIVPCLLPGRAKVDVYSGASIYPAVQNLLLAARAIGLGGTLTTLQALCDLDPSGTPTRYQEFYQQLKHLLAMPETAVPVAVIPLGWPRHPFGEGNRHPVRAITYQDRYGHAWSEG
jgi:nitroreductase